MTSRWCHDTAMTSLDEPGSVKNNLKMVKIGLESAIFRSFIEFLQCQVFYCEWNIKFTLYNLCDDVILLMRPCSEREREFWVQLCGGPRRPVCWLGLGARGGTLRRPKREKKKENRSTFYLYTEKIQINIIILVCPLDPGEPSMFVLSSTVPWLSKNRPKMCHCPVKIRPIPTRIKKVLKKRHKEWAHALVIDTSMMLSSI